MHLLLHIGTEKTATTLLQKWLYDNREALAEQKLFLSNKLGRPNNRKFAAFFEADLADFARQNGIRNAQDRARYFDRFAELVAEEVKGAEEAGHAVMVITSEHFHSRLRTPEEIAALKAFLDPLFARITVLCYFRDQADVRQSLYSTALKGYSDETLADFHSDAASRYYYDYHRIASLWASAFGRENTDFRIFDPARFPGGDIRRDFLQAAPVKLDAARLWFDEARENVSLGPFQAEAYRAINSAIPYWRKQGGVNPVNDRFKAAVDKSEKASAGKISDPRKQALRAELAQSNTALFRDFFDSENQFAPKAEEAAEEEARYTQSEVAALVHDLVFALAETLGHVALSFEDINRIRDAALSYERGETLTKAEALALMKIARRARPNGSLIRRKVEAWSAD